MIHKGIALLLLENFSNVMNNEKNQEQVKKVKFSFLLSLILPAFSSIT